MSKLVATKRPKWLQKIAEESERIKKQEEAIGTPIELTNNLFEIRMQLAILKLQMVEGIEAINDKYKTEYIFEDLFNVTTEEEQQAIDFLEPDED
jgi:hypothetical protein